MVILFMVSINRYAGANALDEARLGRGEPLSGPAPLPARLIVIGRILLMVNLQRYWNFFGYESFC